MKAWVYRRYGSPDVLAYEEIEAKVPGAKDIEIRVRAAGLNAADWHIMRGDPFLARISVGAAQAPSPEDHRLGRRRHRRERGRQGLPLLTR